MRPLLQKILRSSLYFFLFLFSKAFTHTLYSSEILLANSIYHDYGSCSFYELLIEGMKVPFYDPYWSDSFENAYSAYLKSIGSAPQLQSRLKMAQEYISKEVIKDEFETLVEGKLYFRKLLHGSIELVNSKKTEIEFLFLIKDWKGGNTAGSYSLSEPIKAHLNDLIPGLALGLMGMKLGERREILVHPEYGYGLFSDFADGMPFWIVVEVLSSFESKRRLSLSNYPVDLLKILPNNYQALNDFEKAKINYWKNKGTKLREFFEEKIPTIDLNFLLKNLPKPQATCLDDKETANCIFWNAYTKN